MAAAVGAVWSERIGFFVLKQETMKSSESYDGCKKYDWSAWVEQAEGPDTNQTDTEPPISKCFYGLVCYIDAYQIKK